MAFRVAAVIVVTALAGAAAAYELDGNKLKLPGPVAFEPGSDRIKPESDAALKHVKAYLDDKSYITLLRIEVHTEGDGDAAAN
jgi:outer membrane protein OmpA-like peptidoglycan-associated protein